MPEKVDVRLLVVVVWIGLLAAACGGGGSDLTVRGMPVANANEILADAERIHSEAVREADGTVADETACFFLVEREHDDGVEVRDELLCGPAFHHYTEHLGKAWDRVGIEYFGEGEEGVEFVASGVIDSGRDAPDEGQLVAVGDRDGAASLSADLDPPAPPDFEAGTITNPPEAPRTFADPVGRAMLRGYDWEFAIHGYEEVDGVGEGAEYRVAAAGQRLLLLEVSLDFEGGLSQSGPELALVVDGTSHNLDANALGLYGDNRGELLLNVPEGAELTLESLESGIEQSMTLPDGVHREVVEVWYRGDKRQVIDEVNIDYTLPFALVRSSGPLWEPGKYPTLIKGQGVALDFRTPGGTAEATNYDQAVLFIKGLSSHGGNGWRMHEPVGEVFTLEVDGEKRPPDGTYGPALRSGPTDGSPYWEVPADFVGGTIHIDPNEGRHRGTGPTLIYEDDAAVAIDFAFGP